MYMARSFLEFFYHLNLFFGGLGHRVNRLLLINFYGDGMFVA